MKEEKQKKEIKKEKKGLKNEAKVGKKENQQKMKKKNTSRSSDKGKKMVKFLVVGILLFAMVFTSFSYLVYALQSL